MHTATKSGAVCKRQQAERATAAPRRVWMCPHCGKEFTTDDAIRVRDSRGALTPIHVCMLKDIELWFNPIAYGYALVTQDNIRPGCVRQWWGCYRPDRMSDNDHADTSLMGRI